MTKKEAVEILRHADTDSEVDADDYLKAFDMAVSALESESNREDFLKELDKLKERYEKNFRNIHKAEVVSVMRYMEIFHHDLLKREEHPIYPGHNKDDKVVVIGGSGSPIKRTIAEQMLGHANCERCFKKDTDYCIKGRWLMPRTCEDFQPMADGSSTKEKKQ